MEVKSGQGLLRQFRARERSAHGAKSAFINFELCVIDGQRAGSLAPAARYALAAHSVRSVSSAPETSPRQSSGGQHAIQMHIQRNMNNRNRVRGSLGLAALSLAARIESNRLFTFTSVTFSIASGPGNYGAPQQEASSKKKAKRDFQCRAARAVRPKSTGKLQRMHVSLSFLFFSLRFISLAETKRLAVIYGFHVIQVAHFRYRFESIARHAHFHRIEIYVAAGTTLR